ncbi:pregnancy zone protein [Trichonephila clavipes]|nr:pregnancy zone protein [Trichonephila clavipes]
MTNMVVVSIKMPSGYVPDEWKLHQLRSKTEVQLKRHELDGNQVNLYFNELTNEQKCFTVFIKSETEVEEIKPASIKLYDYYQPEIEITKEYIVPTNCTQTTLPTPEPDIEASSTVSSFQTANTGSEELTIVSTDPGLEMTEVKPVSTEPPPEYDTTILNEGVGTSQTIEESLSTETIIGTKAPTDDKDLLISGTAETLAAFDSTKESTTI